MNFTLNRRKHKSQSKTLITFQMKFPFLSQLAIDPLLPKNVDEVLQNPNWFEAMKNEYDSLIENNVWSLVKSDEKPVGGRWHFALKFGPGGNICHHKARFVAKGFSQVFGKDFYETYSPTTRLLTIRILMSLAISNDYQFKKMDKKLLISMLRLKKM